MILRSSWNGPLNLYKKRYFIAGRIIQHSRGVTGCLKNLGETILFKENKTKNWDDKRIKTQNKKNPIKVRHKPPHPFATHTKSLTIQLFDHFLTITHENNKQTILRCYSYQ